MACRWVATQGKSFQNGSSLKVTPSLGWMRVCLSPHSFSHARAWWWSRNHMSPLVGLHPQAQLCISWEFRLMSPWEPNLLWDEVNWRMK